MTTRHHAIDYVELAVGDVARARRFYGDAFGWSFNDYGEDYAGIRGPGGEGEIGGLDGSAEGGGDGGPLVLLFSEDLDATVRAIEQAGGRILVAPYDFPGGRRFHFADPAGNQLGVWTAT